MLYILTRPACLVALCISWRHLCSLCWYGRLHRNVPILGACLLWWFGAVLYGMWLWRCYDRHKYPTIFRVVLSREGTLAFVGEDSSGRQEELAAREISVKWYVKRQNSCQLFLRDRRVLLLDIQELTREEEAFLGLKLSTVSLSGKRAWRLAAGIFLMAVTLYGGCLVVKSAIPYNGKLAWYLDDLKDKRTVTLKHDNVYDTGIEGVLEDIRGAVNLQETLCLSTSFNLRFAPDGRILTLDTMLYGFDEDGKFVDSYLITYHAGRSRKISIYLHGAGSATYQEEKDLKPLVDAVSAMSLQETVAQWEDENCYGILYYGERQWYSREGIRFLDGRGDWWLPGSDEYSFSGYSISVFCPENEALTPVRYVYEGWRRQPF